MKNIRQICFSLFFILTVFFHFYKPESVTAINTDGVQLPILMYHKVSENKKSWGDYSISPKELEADIKLILSRGFTPINISDLENHKNGTAALPKKPIILTFDDGTRSDYTKVFPLAKKYKIKVVCSTVGLYTEEYSGDKGNTYLSWKEMQEMQESGFVEFQNHSYNLHNFDSSRKGCLKSEGESDKDYRSLILEDFAHAQKLFTDNNIKTPTCFTYPYGMRDELLLQHVKDAGFTCSLGTYARINVLNGDLYDLHRFNRPHNYNIEKILDMVK